MKRRQLPSGHFKGGRMGTPFPLLVSRRNEWEERSHC